MSAPVALVTGGGKRVGAVVAQALAGRGFRVAVHYNTSSEEARRTVAAIGHGAKAFGAELGDAEAPRRLVNDVMQAFGRLDVLVNSASNFIRAPIDRVDVETWNRILDVNLRAPFFLALEAAKQMREGGCIVNMSDLAAFEAWPDYIPHGVSKAGVTYMTRALATQLAPRVRVNAIAPGVVLLPDDASPEQSEQLRRSTPLRRHGSPEDVARAVLYLVDAEFVTGDVLFVDGGRHVRR
ncbi:MAG: SDR family oxidoreductase [Gemmatimonadaceae bacterium]|nr:SDR family oxidoreductase [Gemmatimonadaceae bacterium]